jgi:glycosyltransferase involved in cell wall biosynthesis
LLVSISVPVYNEEPYIENLLESIVKDEYRNKEIIISDNFSSDRTWEIINNFKNKYGKLYDIFIKQQLTNMGAVYNFNYVLEKSRGEFFIWAGGHDIWGHNMIQDSVSALQKNQDAVLAMPMVKWIDNRSDLLDLRHSIIDTRQGGSPAGRVLELINQYSECTAIYGLHRKKILLDTMPWPKTLGNDDFALVRLAKKGNIIPVKSACYFRRVRLFESSDDRVQRQLRALDVKGFASKKPRTVFKVYMFFEVIQSKGPFLTRLQLFFLAFQKYLGVSLLKTLLLEYSPTLFNFFKKIKVHFSNHEQVNR